MGQSQAGCWVEFFQEEDGDEVAIVEPEHVIRPPVERTQLIRFELIVPADRKVEIVFEQRTTL